MEFIKDDLMFFLNQLKTWGVWERTVSWEPILTVAPMWYFIDVSVLSYSSLPTLIFFFSLSINSLAHTSVILQLNWQHLFLPLQLSIWKPEEQPTRYRLLFYCKTGCVKQMNERWVNDHRLKLESFSDLCIISLISKFPKNFKCFLMI